MALIKLNSRAIPDSTVVNTDIADGSVTQAKIVDGSISSAKIASDAVTTAKIANTVNLGRRNLLINGNFDVWQRATSYTDVAGIWNYGHADRWNGHNDGGNAGTWSQSTVVPNAGSTYSMLMTGASTVTNTNFSQRIESTSLKGIRERNSFTVSGYVRSATAGKVIHCHALCPTATDNYASYTQHNLVMSSVTISGNGGAGTSQITLTDANTWYYFTMTKTSATSLTNFDKGYAVFFGIIGQTSTSHQVYMSQLQVEAGDTATPFEHRSYGEELSLCQRYYQRTQGTSSGYQNLVVLTNYSTGADQRGVIPFVTEMRVGPAISTSGNLMILGAGGGLSSISAGDGLTTHMAGIRVNTNSNLSTGQSTLLRGNNDGTAHLKFDAEI